MRNYRTVSFNGLLRILLKLQDMKFLGNGVKNTLSFNTGKIDRNEIYEKPNSNISQQETRTEKYVHAV